MIKGFLSKKTSFIGRNRPLVQSQCEFYDPELTPTFAHAGSLNQERKLDTLRKKEVDNLTEYLARKEERIEKKNNKSKHQDNGHTKMDSSTAETTTESEVKRPKLELTS